VKLISIFADEPHEYNCSAHNIVNPTNAINKTGIHTAEYIQIKEFITNSPETQKKCMEADAIIFERNFFQDAVLVLTQYYLWGQTIIGIWDDAYNLMHKKNPAYPFWEHGEVVGVDEKGIQHKAYLKVKPLTQMKIAVGMLKGAQVVSDKLVESWSPYVTCYKIHNHLVIDRYKNAKEPLFPHDGIWIGWSGSQSHRDSFESSGILRAYRKILNKYPNVKILIAGDKTIFDSLDVPNDRKMFCGYVPEEQYPALIKSFDIYTIPLTGEYDLCRSQIKPVECCALKVPWIATDYPNYTHLKEYGNFTENGKDNWEYAISSAIDNLSQLREKSEEIAYPFALTQDIDLHVQERIDLYQKLIDGPYRY
jgi:glycosyltransferase involved in cell wall biosynthesis